MSKKKPSSKPSVTDTPGIKEFAWVDPKTLSAHEKNWKKHPHRQRQAYNALKKKTGWAGAAVYNRTTGRLVDGHMRREEAIRNGELLPVLIGEWTPEEELLLLQNLDPLGTLAETNAAALASLTEENAKSIKNITKKFGTDSLKSLTNLNRDVSSYAASVELGNTPSVLLDRKKTKDSTPEVDEEIQTGDDGITQTTFKDDVIFQDCDPWGIPYLRSDMLCDVVPDVVWNRDPATVTPTSWYCYSAGPSTIPKPEVRNGGILGFFTEDFRFDITWNQAPDFVQRLLKDDFAGVVAPDFSTWSDWPFAIRLHNLYKSRWCARYWQEAGIRVIPIIQSIGDTPLVHGREEFDVGYSDLVISTLPQKIPVAAVQVRTAERSSTDYWRGVAVAIDVAVQSIKIDNLVIYGGKEYEKYLSGHLPKSRRTKYHYLDSYTSKRRKKRDTE